MKEIWKSIKGYPNYMVSNMGNVKSLGRLVDRKSKGKRWQEEKILKPKIDNREGKGYLFVCLYKNGVKKWYPIHRLVYEAFYGIIPQGMQVNHINEIKSDNRLENLNLMTPKENANWGTRNERVTEKTTNGKLSKPVVQMDKTNKIIAEFPSIMEVQRRLGISVSHISKCCKGGFFHKERNKWVNVSQAYGFKWQYKKGDY